MGFSCKKARKLGGASTATRHETSGWRRLLGLESPLARVAVIVGVAAGISPQAPARLQVVTVSRSSSV
jgi:hypothetical protein